MFRAFIVLLALVPALQAQLITPSLETVQLAAQVGAKQKESWRLENACMIEKRGINVVIKTPLFLAAKHAKSQAQDYREPDKDYLKYLETFKFVRIQCVNVGPVIAAELEGSRKVILLRDGVRVPTVRKIPSFNGKDPFNIIKPDYGLSKVMASVEKQANSYARMWFEQMTPEQREQFVKTQVRAGKTPEEISRMTGWSEEEIQKVAPKADARPSIEFTDDDGVFTLEELSKPGKYEVVLRLPSIGYVAPFGSRDTEREHKIPVKFDQDTKLLKLIK